MKDGFSLQEKILKIILDYQNINNNKKNNNKEYMRNTFYKNNDSNNSANTKRNYKSNYEQRVYPEKDFLINFMQILNNKFCTKIDFF